MTSEFTPNKDSRNGLHPQIIVIHIAEGSTKSVIEEFKNPKTEKSSHYLINRDGSVIQFVDEKLSAWCNGIVWKPQSTIVRDAYLKGISINKISISIECEGFSWQDPTEAYYKTVVQMVKDISRRYNIPIDQNHVIPHRWIRADKTCPGRISVGKIIADCNAPIAPVAPTIPTGAPTIELNPPIFAQPTWMQNLIYRTKQTFGFADPMFGGVPRSSKWSNLRNEFLKENPNCQACGVKAETVHHIEPYHINPALELQKTNLIALCDECHLVLAHLKNFKRYDIEIREVAKLFKNKIDMYKKPVENLFKLD